MKMAKRVIAGCAALTMILGVATSCTKGGSTSKKGEGFTSEQEKIVEEMKKKVPSDAKDSLKNKEITWLAHYDINPDKGKAASPALTLFQDCYGG
ncbi:MAG: hypothetical protein ACI4RN_05595, partial [Oscillospiraceae bacterium]